jgi:hypothetical protein
MLKSPKDFVLLLCRLAYFRKAGVKGSNPFFGFLDPPVAEHDLDRLPRRFIFFQQMLRRNHPEDLFRAGQAARDFQ